MATFNRTALAKILGILDSGQTGEALAAGRLASAMIREAGLTWNDVLAPEIEAKAAVSPVTPAPAPAPSATGTSATGTSPGTATGSGPFGYRKDRELSPHEQFFMVLLSPRTPLELKRRLRGWETRVLDGEITPQETQDLHAMYQNFVT